MVPVAASASPTTARISEIEMFWLITRRDFDGPVDSRKGTCLQVVVHQGDAGGVRGDVGTREAHGNADVGSRENGAVVDAVADDQSVRCPLLDEVLEFLVLLLGQAFSLDGSPRPRPGRLAWPPRGGRP